MSTNLISIKIETDLAPKPIGPYSQAVLKDNWLYISGQIPLDLKTGHMVADISEATVVVMSHLKAILSEAGMSFKDVVKSTIYLTDLKNFATVNTIYGECFSACETCPARETVQVAGLPKGAVVEISMIAHKSH